MTDVKSTTTPGTTVGSDRNTQHPGVARAGAGQTYTTQEGDTPGQIAQRHLGDWNRWTEVVAANPKVFADHAWMPVGTSLVMPEDFQPSQQ